MADEAVLRIVLNNESVPPPAPAPTTPTTAQPTPPPPPKPPPPPPIDPGMFGASYTATAKDLLRPMQFLDNRVKERVFLANLLAHPELQAGGLQKELKRLGEERLAMMSGFRAATGKPERTGLATHTTGTTCTCKSTRCRSGTAPATATTKVTTSRQPVLRRKRSQAPSGKISWSRAQEKRAGRGARQTSSRS